MKTRSFESVAREVALAIGIVSLAMLPLFCAAAAVALTIQ